MHICLLTFFGVVYAFLKVFFEGLGGEIANENPARIAKEALT